MEPILVEVKSFGSVRPKNKANPRQAYEHQKTAMANLDIINKSKAYSTLVVLPTGGGKTYTASTWLLRNALDQKKKILWIAHRQMLLDQAAESFQQYAYKELMPHISSFSYRIVSGSSKHERTIDISPKDQLLIASKDGIGRNLACLDSWLKGEKEVFVIVDEAHHSTAKTYRKVIDYVMGKVPNVKLIGLTATPFRTSEAEKGLLAKLYHDGIRNGKAVHDDIGITYQIGLTDLINRQILSRPIFLECETDENFGKGMGVNAWESIQHFDKIPDDIAGEMAESAARNKLIVDTYKKNQQEYGQTIVFAVNILHAIHLTSVFDKAGIKADYVVSSIKDAATGVTISPEENEKKLEAYRNGDLQVLVNVNILTEGVDLPQTKTVFLTRPTVSKILMTQMIGRALRGTAAGGTKEAYIVSFIDNWNEHISWVNPESLFEDGCDDFTDTVAEKGKRILRSISISKIAEFASLLDDSIDTTALEMVDFQKRIPIGMYAFTYLEEESGTDVSNEVMVYDSTREAYQKLMDALPELFRAFPNVEDRLSDADLERMEELCQDNFFYDEVIPAYDKRDIISILKYYAQKEIAPQFYSFDEIDRNKLDVAQIAKHIYDEDMGTRKKAAYLDQLWNDTDDNMLRLFFGKKLYFLRQIDTELLKLQGVYDEEKETQSSSVDFGKKAITAFPIYEIEKRYPEMAKQLKEYAFAKGRTENGEYQCAVCGKRSRKKIDFQVDHIVPMNKGGRSVASNLQILCRTCNGRKSDRL